MQVQLVAVHEDWMGHAMYIHFILARPEGGSTWYSSDYVPSYRCMRPHIGEVRTVWLDHHVPTYGNRPSFDTTSGAFAFCLEQQ